MKKPDLSKVIRVVTIAPLMALLLLVVVYIARPQYFGGGLNFALAVLFLVVFPVLAYPLQPLVPRYRDRGREGQRSLAIWMAGIGYCCGIIAAALTNVPGQLWIIYLTYFISGLLIILFNKVIKVRASGHMCGVAGPMFLLICFRELAALLYIVILVVVYRSSLYMKRHSRTEMFAGASIPVLAVLVALLMVGAAG